MTTITSTRRPVSPAPATAPKPRSRRPKAQRARAIEPAYEPQLTPQHNRVPRIVVNPCRRATTPVRIPARTAIAHDEFVPRATGRAQLPAPIPVVRRFAQGILDVLSGRRPATQLMGAVTGELYEQLALGTATRIRPRSAARVPTVLSMRLSEPDDGVAEASVVVRDGTDFYAMALRFEGLDGAWRCSFFAII